ncbi:MAG: hypothetical protein HZT40_00785 [Candidatus Thiothrix singaporensis]|uniref:Nuclear transport factor 2 family protein n=1 Tax=Candidatus Thiothrix singaporensis TaxID=2799669 RepID=A0A7L6AMX9_9GAMM|nr:MAG: hypothetical protein HZT40_00785 [Candidatus Thiothrix singaporensis]
MKINKTLWALLAGSLLTGCGSAESVLTEYATNRWNALIQGDLAQAYQYYTDAFKATTPLDVFKHKVHGTGLWNKAKVDKVQCEEPGKRCQVDVEVTVSMKMRGLSKPMETSDVVHETWVKDGWFSDWRYVKE